MSNFSENNIQKTLATYRPQTPELELPIEADFASIPPRLTPNEMHQWCEETISLGANKKRNGNPENHVEFVLRK